MSCQTTLLVSSVSKTVDLLRELKHILIIKPFYTSITSEIHFSALCISNDTDICLTSLFNKFILHSIVIISWNKFSWIWTSITKFSVQLKKSQIPSNFKQNTKTAVSILFKMFPNYVLKECITCLDAAEAFWTLSHFHSFIIVTYCLRYILQFVVCIPSIWKARREFLETRTIWRGESSPCWSVIVRSLAVVGVIAAVQQADPEELTVYQFVLFEPVAMVEEPSVVASHQHYRLYQHLQVLSK